MPGAGKLNWPPAVTWDPNNKGATVYLSNGNLTATAPNTASQGVVLSNVLITNGSVTKYYWENVINATPANIGVGIANSATVALNTAFYPNATGFLNNGSQYIVNAGTSSSFPLSVGVGGVFGFTITYISPSFYNLNVYYGNLLQFNIAVSGNTWYACCGDYAGVINSITANFTAASFVYTPPGGYGPIPPP
jgi:hypothetical protein